MIKTTQFRASVVNAIDVVGLEVNGETMGSSHTFKFEGHRVVVKIPSLGSGDTDPWYSKFSWKTVDPENPKTTWYRVNRLHLQTDTNEIVQTDARVMRRPIKAFDLIGKDEEKRADDLLDVNANRLERAYRYWQEVIRWVTRNPSLGLPNVQVPQGAFQGARLVRSRDGKAYWSAAGVIISSRGSRLDLDGWKLVERVLKGGVEVPLWFVFIAEFRHRIFSGDLVGSILSLAIACETVMRSILWKQALEPSNPLVVELIERSNAQTIIGWWAKLTGETKADLKAVPLSDVHKIFDLRNKVIHEGARSVLDLDELQKLGKSASTFIEHADTINRRLWKQTDWRHVVTG